MQNNNTVDILTQDIKPPEYRYYDVTNAPTQKSSYYRSTAFISNNSINSLTAAASPLLTLATSLYGTADYQDLHNLYQCLVHEINAFETNAQKQGYRAETILVARYLLCATLDDIIMHTSWGKNSTWCNLNLLNTFHNEKTSDDRFYFILERTRENPKQHIEILELIFLCMSLGFQGKFRHEATGKTQLDEILDELYQIIRLQRNEPALIFKKNNLEAKPAHQNKAISYSLKTLAIVIVITGFIYLCFNYIFFNMTYVFNQDIQKINQELVQSAKGNPSVELENAKMSS